MGPKDLRTGSWKTQIQKREVLAGLTARTQAIVV